MGWGPYPADVHGAAAIGARCRENLAGTFSRTSAQKGEGFGLSAHLGYGAAISACEKGGKWQEALGLLDWMLQIRLLPSDICRMACTMSMRDFAGGSSLQKTAEAEAGMLPSVRVSALDANIRGYARGPCKCIEHLGHLLARKSEQWQKALLLLPCGCIAVW